MGQSYDPDRPNGKRLPPVAPPPKKVGSPNGSIPDMSAFRGLAGSSSPPTGSFGPLPKVSAPPGRSGPPLPPVAPPPRRPVPPAPPSRDPLAESITHVRGGPNQPDTLPDRGRYDDSLPGDWSTTGEGAKSVTAEPLDWEDEEESTHVFSSAPPPDESPRYGRPAPPQPSSTIRGGAAPPFAAPRAPTLAEARPRSAAASYDAPSSIPSWDANEGHDAPEHRHGDDRGGYGADGYGADGYGADGYGADGYGSPRADAEGWRAVESPSRPAPSWDDGPRRAPAGWPSPPSPANGVARGLGEVTAHGPIGGLSARTLAEPPGSDTLRLDERAQGSGAPGLDPAPVRPGPSFPPPPPVPSIPVPRGHDSAAPPGFQGAGLPGQQGPEASADARDQAFVRLPTGNPASATELAVRRPAVLPGLPPAQPSELGPKKWILAVAGAAALASILALTGFLFSRRPGGLEVDVREAGGASVPKAEVFIDGRKVCDATPCVVRDLDVGLHTIRVVAGATSLDPVSAEVKPGEIGRVSVTTKPSLGVLVASGNQAGVRLFVDGVDRGSLPAKLEDLSPGTHQIKLGGDRFKPFEKTIEVKAGETVDLGAPKLEVVKGRVVVTVKTDGVRIVLVRNGDTARAKALDGPFPRPIEVDTASGSWKLVATKRGLPDFVAPIDFADGVAEKAIEVELKDPKAAPPEPPPEPAKPAPEPAKPAPEPAKPAPEPAKPKPEPVAEAPSGTGTLNINSIPASRVLLDGQPMGETPRMGVQVSAGTHTVTFIHPELGKKSVSVKVGPGETKTASARLRSE